jgi:hypothetical protein
MRLFISDASKAAPNMQLAPLLGKAFALRETLLNGPHDRIKAMSKALQLGKGYNNARIGLTFLSPNLIRKILSGDMPDTVSPIRLLEASKDLPVKWADQDRFIEALPRWVFRQRTPNVSYPPAQKRHAETRGQMPPNSAADRVSADDVPKPRRATHGNHGAIRRAARETENWQEVRKRWLGNLDSNQD